MYSDWNGRGLGYPLVTRLIDVARKQGIGELVGEVLRENEPMLQICRELGFAVSVEVTSVKVVEKDVSEEVGKGQAAMGGSFAGSTSISGSVSSAMPSICM